MSKENKQDRVVLGLAPLHLLKMQSSCKNCKSSQRCTPSIQTGLYHFTRLCLYHVCFLSFSQDRNPARLLPLIPGTSGAARVATGPKASLFIEFKNKEKRKKAHLKYSKHKTKHLFCKATPNICLCLVCIFGFLT